MNLAEYQRAMMRVSFAREPSEADLRALGDETRFRLYRHMVRTRLIGMARVAFKESVALAGEALFEEVFERFLERTPPQSPLIREVIAAFGVFALADRAWSESSRVLRDLSSFELAKWQLAYQPASVPRVGEEGVRELDFEGVLVKNPVLRVLTLDHPVHREREAWSQQGPVSLLVYRPPGIDEVRFWAVDPFFAALLDPMRANPSETLAEAVRNTAQRLARPLDQGLLEGLSDHLTLALQRGVVIGVREA